MRRAVIGVFALAIAAPALAACPVAKVHPETAKLVQMGAGGSEDLKAFEATLSAPQTACASNGTSVKISLTFQVDASLAPYVEAKPVKVPYFVVVMYDGAVVAKEIFPVTLGFGPGSATVKAAETVDKISLPLRRNAKPDYEILVGFQLTPGQLRAVQN